jgi:excisionase family DNA binding protein
MNIEMFTEYDDVVSVADVANMLHISKVTVYDLLKSGRIFTLRVGRRYIIPKKSIIDFKTSQLLRCLLLNHHWLTGL